MILAKHANMLTMMQQYVLSFGRLEGHALMQASTIKN
jgi:hypothetical protein